ncbi:MAG: thioredoxin [Bdellovibrionota bacterium]
MQTHPVTMQTFDDVIEQNEMVLLDFWAGWCQPCKMLAPVFEELAKHNTDIYFGKVNTEECQDLAGAFQVRSIPTLMAFKKGELVFEQPGLPTPAQLSQLLEGLRKLVPQPSPAMEEEV